MLEALPDPILNESAPPDAKASHNSNTGFRCGGPAHLGDACRIAEVSDFLHKNSASSVIRHASGLRINEHVALRGGANHPKALRNSLGSASYPFDSLCDSGWRKLVPLVIGPTLPHL